MEVELGTKGKEHSFQEVFPEETVCDCGGMARIALTIAEEAAEDKYICSLHENKEGNFWPHDAVAISIYFCKDCFKAIALWNQA